MKSKCICRFEENIYAAESLEPLYSFLSNNAENMDASYLLRSEFVLIVSALDTYMHMIIEDRIVNSYFDVNSNLGTLEIQISKIKAVNMNNSAYDKAGMLRSIIRERLQQDSFQAPKSIEYAFGLIGIKKVWSSIKNEMGMDSKNIIDKLALIVNRRNMIAHESDRNRVTGELQQIDLDMVIDCKNFIIKLVNQFEALLS